MIWATCPTCAALGANTELYHLPHLQTQLQPCDQNLKRVPSMALRTRGEYLGIMGVTMEDFT